jgi:hypothetical protein
MTNTMHIPSLDEHINAIVALLGVDPTIGNHANETLTLIARLLPHCSTISAANFTSNFVEICICTV